jgi:hypothetical protein
LTEFGSLDLVTDLHASEPAASVRRLPVKTLVVSSAAGAVIVPAALLLGLVYRPTGGWPVALVYGVAVWAAFVMSTAAVTLAVRATDRRVRLVLLVLVAAAMCGGVPVGTFATFAVSYAPAGADCPSCAVIAYFSRGPWSGFTADASTFDQVLCGSRRAALRAQAQGFRRDIEAMSAWSGWGLFDIGSYDEAITARGGTTTVVGQVRLTLAKLDANGHTQLHETGGQVWTFTLTHDDGWQVCGVGAPPLCDVVLRCVAPLGLPPAASPSPSSSDPVGALLAPLEPLQRCGPDDPFRQWHDCPPAVSGSPSRP